MKLFELFATLELQADKFNDGINKARGTAEGFAGKVASSVSAGTIALGNLMAKGVEAAVGAVKKLGSDAIDLAGQLEQNVGGSMAVFGAWAENVQEKSARAFETMGLSAADYLATANQMGSLFKGAGFTTVEAMELTTEAMQRAADVASIMGIDAAWAMESIAGAAKGNFTMMDNLGVAINETTLANYALEKGLKKSTSAMTTQEKVGLAMEMFLERTAEYAGNYAEENATLAGAMQTAKAAWDNLLSGVEEFSEADFVNAIENMFRVVTRNITKIVPRLTSSFAEIAQRAIPKIKTAFTSFWNNDLPGIATQGVNLVISGINQLFGTDIKPIEVIALPTVEEITGKLTALWDGVTSATSELFTWTLGLFTPPDESIDHMGSLATWWYGTALPFITDTFSWTLGIFKEPEEGVDPDGYIAQWWENTALPFLQQTCTWALNMFLPPDENGDITPESVIIGWWENVVGAIEAACTWVLGIFGEPEEDGDQAASVISYWWDSIRQSIIDACQWALGIFGEPVESLADIENVVLAWWDGVVGTVTDACVWFLNLFKAPKSAEGGNGPGAIVATWWNEVVDSVVSACEWYLGLFKSVSSNTDSDGNSATPFGIVQQWWFDTVDAVISACSWFLGLFTGVSSDSDAAGNIATPKKIVGDWWNNTVDAVVAACNWVLGLFTGVSEDTDAEGKPATPEGVVGSWWGTVVDAVVSTCTWAIGCFSGVEDGVDAEGNPVTPGGVVSAWWNTIKAGIIGLCTWAIGSFSEVEEGEGEKAPESIVSAWWSTAKAGIVKACDWAINLFSGVGDTDKDGNTLSTIIDGWWSNQAKLVQTACDWVLGLFSGVDGSEKPDGTRTTAADVVTIWWNNTRASVESVCTWVLGLFDEPTEGEDDVRKKVSGWWSDVVKGAQAACQFVAQFGGLSATDEEGNPISVADAAASWWTTNVLPTLRDLFKWTIGIEWGEWDDFAESDASAWWEEVKSNIARIAGDAVGIGSTLINALFDAGKPVAEGLADAVEVASEEAPLPKILAALSDSISDFVAGARWIIDNVTQFEGAINILSGAFVVLSAATGNFLPLFVTLIALLGDIEKNKQTLKNQSFQEFTSGKYTEDDIELLQTYIELQRELLDFQKEKDWDNAAIKSWSIVESSLEKTKNKLEQSAGKGIFLDYFSWAMQHGSGLAPGGIGKAGALLDERLFVDQYPDVIVKVAEESESLMQKDLDRMSLETNVTMIPDMSQMPKSITVDAVSGPSAQSSDSPSGGGASGKKFAVGLDYVPYDEFPSLLHEGEAVLTKAEATAWRRGETTGSVSIDYDRLGSIVASAVAEAVSGLAIQMDKQAVGSIVSPVVFREMGRQLGTRKFAI